MRLMAISAGGAPRHAVGMARGGRRGAAARVVQSRLRGLRIDRNADRGVDSDKSLAAMRGGSVMGGGHWIIVHTNGRCIRGNENSLDGKRISQGFDNVIQNVPEGV